MMGNHYYFYLKDKTLDPLNNCVDAAIFPAESEEVARKIAGARFADQIAANQNLYVDFDPETGTYSGEFNPYIYEDEEE